MSKKLSNQEYWEEIEALPIFSDQEFPRHDDAWKWLEKLQKENKFRAVDIIAIKQLLSFALMYTVEEK